MKYDVCAIVNDAEYHVKVTCRIDAKKRTVFRKCMNAIGWKLIEEGVITSKATFGYELPNIWTNGFLGAAWFNDPYRYIDVTIWENHGDHGTYIAA